jgi:hypothetical protein
MSAGSPRSRVSRETRLLLMTMLLSVIVLVTLARIRFPQRPVTPNLVSPILAQLTSASPFEELADAVSAVEAQVVPSLHLLTIQQTPSGAPERITALRFSGDTAIALVAEGQAAGFGGHVIARDRVTGLTLIRTSSSPTPARPIWTPQQAGESRYLLFTNASASGPSLHPVFVGPLTTFASARWRTPVWLIPRQLRVPEAGFVFTTTGALAGLVVDEPHGQAIVPGGAVIAVAERLLTTGQTPAGSLGMTVQDLTPPIRTATRLSSGVIVVHVDANGPAAGRLVPTDIIERMDDEPIANVFTWDARLARLAAGQTVSLRVQRSGRSAEVVLTAAALPSTLPATLGLTLRSRPRLGAEVMRVDAGSIAERAGIEVGDILVRVGDVPSPSAAQVHASFDALASGGAVLVAITRGDEPLVVALAKP